MKGTKRISHKVIVTINGIVKNVGYSIEEDDFFNEALSNVRIQEARRLNRRVFNSRN